MTITGMVRRSLVSAWAGAAFLLLPAGAEAAPVGVEAVTAYVLDHSEVRTMHAAAGDSYRIYVQRPATPPPPGGYPILYLLDGDQSFPVAAAIAGQFGPYLGLEPGVIVAIGYGGPSRRVADYTPPVPIEARLDKSLPRSGGADRLLAFIADELRPAVERDLPVDPDRRTIAGYSLGGLFVLHAFFARPQLFHSYVASSPSIWLVRDHLFRAADASAQRRPAFARRRLLLSAGQWEETPDPGASAADHERLAQAHMIGNARNLSRRLATLPGLTVRFDIVPGETHASGSLPSIRAALVEAFSPRPAP
ncbi:MULTISPECIES: alpha/beta hydrolase [unclassified Sphingomonas]|uniref:alpha/beta hydrolase n=1 Tax=unclassified Sphingomonas TaxID=196159 RepID=UPI000A40EB62|nr:MULTISPECIES: alpha/beta hydrolase-fold protein [unclassified Sphingomonas]